MAAIEWSANFGWLTVTVAHWPLGQLQSCRRLHWPIVVAESSSIYLFSFTFSQHERNEIPDKRRKVQTAKCLRGINLKRPNRWLAMAIAVTIVVVAVAVFVNAAVALQIYD